MENQESLTEWKLIKNDFLPIFMHVHLHQTLAVSNKPLD